VFLLTGTIIGLNREDFNLDGKSPARESALAGR
jgi:hypothetical protein